MARPKRTTPWLDTRDEVFYAFWYDAENRETKRVSLRTRDSGEAEARFAEFLLNGREIRSPRPKTLTVSRALDDYLLEHVDKNCADSKRQHDAATHLKAFMGDRALGEVDVPLSQAYTTARLAGHIGGGKRRKDKRASSATVRRELNVLVAAANHAVWMKRTKETVSVDLPPERRLGPDDEAPYYTHAELERIFTKAREIADAERAENPDDPHAGEFEHFIHLLYQTGARQRSIRDLSRDQVKVDAKRILLQKPGKKSTKKRQPIVPILKAMSPIIEIILSTERRDRLFRQADFYRTYKRVCALAGIEEGRRHPHIMRHTRATHLLQDGKSLYDVAKLLGDTVATVERVYGHHSHEHLAGKLED